MQYQAESLAQALRLAEAKAQELVKSVPESLAPQLESHSFLLLLDVQKVLRQAIALQQLAALPKVAPLMEPPHLSQVQKEEISLGLPEELLGQMAELSRQGIARLAQKALEEVEAMAEVLPPRERELVEVPLLEEE